MLQALFKTRIIKEGVIMIKRTYPEQIFVLLTFMLIIFFSHYGLSQTFITISGTITDEKHNPIPRATITISNNIGFSKPVTSDSQGRYRVSELNPGIYKIKVEISGFAIEEMDDVYLYQSNEVVLNFTLRTIPISEPTNPPVVPPIKTIKGTLKPKPPDLPKREIEVVEQTLMNEKDLEDFIDNKSSQKKKLLGIIPIKDNISYFIFENEDKNTNIKIRLINVISESTIKRLMDRNPRSIIIGTHKVNDGYLIILRDF
jgi:hypothetical protein